MSKEETSVRGIYYTIIDGSFRTKVDETHPQAVRREYENKDGVKCIKYERIVDALVGYVEDIQIYDGDFGKTLNIKLDPNEEGKHPILQLNVATNYGEDFLKKVPNIDFDQPVRFRPYGFTDENQREQRGIVVMQNDIKIQNYFYDSANKVAINGFPTPEGDTDGYDKEDWKIHFLQARKFLLNYFAANIVPKLQHRTPALDAIEKIRNMPVPEDVLKDEVIDSEQPPF